MESPSYSSSSTHGHPCCCAHFNAFRCPPPAAYLHVSPFQSQPCSRAHLNTARCPPSAASAHVFATHGQPFALAQASRRTDPQNSFSLSGPPPPSPRPAGRRPPPPPGSPTPPARNGEIRRGQPRQNLHRKDVGPLLEQRPEQRRRVGYQPRLPQPPHQVVLGELAPSGSAQQRGERARQAHDVAIRGARVIGGGDLHGRGGEKWRRACVGAGCEGVRRHPFPESYNFTKIVRIHVIALPG